MSEITYDLLKSKHPMDVRRGMVLQKMGKHTTDTGYVESVNENGDHVVSGRSYLGRKLIPKEAIL